MIGNGFSVWFFIVSPVTSSSFTKSVPEPIYDSIMLSKISSTASTKRGGAFLLHDITMLGPSAIPLADPYRPGCEVIGPALAAFACFEGEASSQGGFCRWVEGTGPQQRSYPEAWGRTDEKICCKRKTSREWLGPRWTMIASRLRSNKEFSSELQEIKVFDANRRAYLLMKVHVNHNMAFLSRILAPG